MKCIKCGQELEYDEGEGNIADGYICFECISEVDIIIIDKNKPDYCQCSMSISNPCIFCRKKLKPIKKHIK